MAPIYGEEKKVRRVTITDTGWEALQALAKEKGLRSVSDLLEKIARGDIDL
jgi:predicted CopG family antitoxin